jgi:hypothetical protein
MLSPAAASCPKPTFAYRLKVNQFASFNRNFAADSDLTIFRRYYLSEHDAGQYV